MLSNKKKKKKPKIFVEKLGTRAQHVTFNYNGCTAKNV